MTDPASSASVPEPEFVDRMLNAMAVMSPGERRVARALLAVKGGEDIGTVNALAGIAKVSGPTVLRALAKLGFNSFGAFQAQVSFEGDQSGGRSPLSRFEDGSYASGGDELATASSRFGELIASTYRRMPQAEFDKAVELIADTSRRTFIAGGRFSQMIAEILYEHLLLVRGGVELIRFDKRDRLDWLVDAGRQNVLFICDMRRYQSDSIALAHEARRRRMRIVVLTDPWLSPIADWADAVLVADTRAGNPFDTLVPALAVIETLLTASVHAIGEKGLTRLKEIESMSGDFAWAGEAQ